MNQQQFKEFRINFLTETKLLADAKSRDYASTDNILSNIESVAAKAGITFEQAWLVFFNKQVSAIERYCRDGKVESEGLDSRIQDSINYLLMLAAKVSVPDSNEHSDALPSIYKLLDKAAERHKQHQKLSPKFEVGQVVYLKEEMGGIKPTYPLIVKSTNYLYNKGWYYRVDYIGNEIEFKEERLSKSELKETYSESLPKIGDSVEIIDGDGHCFKVGTIGTIVGFKPEDFPSYIIKTENSSTTQVLWKSQFKVLPPKPNQKNDNDDKDNDK